MTHGATTVPSLTPPWTALVVLIVVLALSVAMYVALVRRWTHRRTWISISDWARARGYRASVKDCPAPPPLDALKSARLVSQVCVSDGHSSLMRLEASGDTATPEATAGGGAATLPAPVEAALQAAAVELGVAVDELTLVSMERREWPDTGLGCPREGEFYAQVITPGYLVVVGGGGRELEYHTDDGSNVVLCGER